MGYDTQYLGAIEVTFTEDDDARVAKLFTRIQKFLEDPNLSSWRFHDRDGLLTLESGKGAAPVDDLSEIVAFLVNLEKKNKTRFYLSGKIVWSGDQLEDVGVIYADREGRNLLFRRVYPE